MHARLKNAALLLTFSAVLANAPGARSQQIGVFLSPGYSVNSWCTVFSGFVVRTAYVVYQGGPGANGEYKDVRFAIPSPACDASGITSAWVLGQGDVAPAVVQSGVTVSLGSCRTDAVVVARFDFYAFADTDPCPVRVAADPTAPSGMIEFTRCDDEKVYLLEGIIAGNISTANEYPLLLAFTPPSNPIPADGAQGVSVDTGLSALIHFPSIALRCFPLFGDHLKIYFGTTTNPPVIAESPYVTIPIDPGDLLAGTTYYWKYRYTNTLAGNSYVESPLWSFTTESPVATEKKTWGAVKALYR